MDMSQYLEIFIEETKEHLQSLNQCLLQMENVLHYLEGEYEYLQRRRNRLRQIKIVQETELMARRR